MKLSEILSKIDELKPNTFAAEEKIRWLSDLDGRIKREIIDRHEGGADVSFSGYTAETDPDTELLAFAPYDEVYLRWLEARIDYANDEIGRYNNSITMFDDAYERFAKAYKREHLPLQTKFRFF